MHHADRDIDVTTGSRFHPVEIIASMLIKIAAIFLIGATPAAVIAFEVILNGTAMFNHSNVALPLAADRIIRLLVVTPDMHRVHHSVIIRETNSNYGFNLSIWDRMFGTYRPQPVKGHLGMRIGLANFRDQGKLTLPHMLAMPFSGKER
jgi:sterol desaturase/sphingolipid hydroxylase (fatty acid hydroxylase superfamily)